MWLRNRKSISFYALHIVHQLICCYGTVVEGGVVIYTPGACLVARAIFGLSASVALAGLALKNMGSTMFCSPFGCQQCSVQTCFAACKISSTHHLLHVCVTQMQSWMFGYVLIALYYQHNYQS